MLGADKGEIVKDKRKIAYNDALRRRFVIFKLAATGELKTLTAASLKQRIEAGENPNPEESTNIESAPLLRDAFQQFIATCKTKGTKAIYQNTLERIEKFTDLDTLTFGQLDISWLRRFEAELTEANKKQCTVP